MITYLVTLRRSVPIVPTFFNLEEDFFAVDCGTFDADLLRVVIALAGILSNVDNELFLLLLADFDFDSYDDEQFNIYLLQVPFLADYDFFVVYLLTAFFELVAKNCRFENSDNGLVAEGDNYLDSSNLE